ncbi:hypothetical protein K439DRAFT_1618456 [Ramaria rubella]|nr:hypothetical protein K439DRAFT_1618456 [Ramaria rubella]
MRDTGDGDKPELKAGEYCRVRKEIRESGREPGTAYFDYSAAPPRTWLKTHLQESRTAQAAHLCASVIHIIILFQSARRAPSGREYKGTVEVEGGVYIKMRGSRDPRGLQDLGWGGLDAHIGVLACSVEWEMKIREMKRKCGKPRIASTPLFVGSTRAAWDIPPSVIDGNIVHRKKVHDDVSAEPAEPRREASVLLRPRHRRFASNARIPSPIRSRLYSEV